MCIYHIYNLSCLSIISIYSSYSVQEHSDWWMSCYTCLIQRICYTLHTLQYGTYILSPISWWEIGETAIDDIDDGIDNDDHDLPSVHLCIDPIIYQSMISYPPIYRFNLSIYYIYPSISVLWCNLSIHHIYLSIYLSIYLCVSIISIYPSIFHIYLSICLSIYHIFYPSFILSIRLSYLTMSVYHIYHIHLLYLYHVYNISLSYPTITQVHCKIYGKQWY